MTESLSWQFKVCLIGEGYVGKTSIRRKYIGEGFRSNYIPTLGVDFAQKITSTAEGNARLVIWDIAGQSQFQSLRKRYYEGCSGLILVYSVVDRESFDNASKWLVEAHGFMHEFPVLIVVGNKIDLRGYYPEEDIVHHEEGKRFTKAFSEKMNTPAIFIETSALTGENIDEAFNRLTSLMIRPKRDTFVTPVKEEPALASGSNSLGSSASDSAAIKVEEHGAITREEAEIGHDMTELIDLKNRLKQAEQDFRDFSLEVETRLLTLRNTVHVKKIMYEHLRQQLNQTRQEWADAYEEYVKLDKTKKGDLEGKIAKVEELRKKIEEIETSVKTKVSELDLEGSTQ
ncbi:MAG: GTP-binding protein [Promethearchaeota archaeon]